MTHTRDVNITTPADTELISVGAQRIREIKGNIEERMELDHFWSNETNTTLYDADGRHKQLTLGKSAEGYVEEDETLVFTEEVDSNVNLNYRDDQNNEFLITRGDKLAFYEHRQDVAAFYGADVSTIIPDGNNVGGEVRYNYLNAGVSQVYLTSYVDYGNNFSDGVFTAPVAGKYRIIAFDGIYWFTHKILRNGIAFHSLKGSRITVAPGIDIIINLNASDRISLRRTIPTQVYYWPLTNYDVHFTIYNLTE